MLSIYIPESEFYDNSISEFVTIPSRTLELEHSLVAISKWESKWNKAFLGPANKAETEILDYIRCMSKDNIDELTIRHLSNKDIISIQEYIKAPMTATTINNTSGKPSRDVVTSELIYYWMISFNIPFECQYWHLNRLLTLINVCNVKNAPSKKMSKKDTMRSNAELNAARKKALCTSG